jgi:hypothetical protein
VTITLAICKMEWNSAFCTVQIRADREYRILSSIVCTLYFVNDAEIFPAHYTWKVAEKGFKVAFMINKLAMVNPCENILEK